jgi:U3 small nucleolar RNA-associated protein MPP10
MESALPTTNSASTLLAPEEVYTAQKQLTASDKSTLTPAQKKALRQKERTERKSVHEKVERIKDAKLKKRGIKGEKELAREQLVGTKGVTVIGKGGKEEKATSKKRKRGDDGNKAVPTSIGLKL